MSSTPYLLVLVSAFTHAWWNYRLKQSGGGQLFVGLSKIGEAVLFAPAFLLLGLPGPETRSALLPLAVVGAALTLANYALLASAYRRAELSLVYPVSRGGVLLFIPVLGFLAFGERIDLVGGVSFVLILAGIVCLQLPDLSRASLRGLAGHLGAGPGAITALLAGAAAAGYTVWDKHAVTSIAPFTYFYAYTALVALAYGGYIGRAHGWAAARREWRGHRGAILQVAVLNTVTYLLVLLALQTGTSSYVVALRQLSVAFGALLGWRLLREPLAPPRQLGVALILVGSVLVGLAR